MKLVGVLKKLLGEHQERRKKETDEVLTEFQTMKLRG